MDIRNSVGSASDGSSAGLAVPDTSSLSSDGGLSAESAGVLGVLGDFHLLDLLSQGSTVTIPTVSTFIRLERSIPRVSPVSIFRCSKALLNG